MQKDRKEKRAVAGIIVAAVVLAAALYFLCGSLAEGQGWGRGPWGRGGTVQGTGTADTSYVVSDMLRYYPMPDIPNPKSYWAWSSQLFTGSGPQYSRDTVEIAVNDTQLCGQWDITGHACGVIRVGTFRAASSNVNPYVYNVLDSLVMLWREYREEDTPGPLTGRCLVGPTSGLGDTVRLSSFCFLPMSPLRTQRYATQYAVYSDDSIAGLRTRTVTVQMWIPITRNGRLYIINRAAQPVELAVELAIEYSDSLIDFGPMSHFHVDESNATIGSGAAHIARFRISGLGRGYAMGNSFGAAIYSSETGRLNWRYFTVDDTFRYSVMTAPARIWAGNATLTAWASCSNWQNNPNAIKALSEINEIWAVRVGHPDSSDILFPYGGTFYSPVRDSLRLSAHAGYTLNARAYTTGDTLWWMAMAAKSRTHHIDTDVGGDKNLPTNAMFQTVWGSAKLRHTVGAGPNGWLCFYPLPWAFDSLYEMMAFNGSLAGADAITALRAVQYSWTEETPFAFAP